MANKRTLSATDILLACGALLIVVALFVLASASWGTFSPASRIITAVIPLLALYGIGFGSRTKPEHRQLSQATIITGSIILPLVLGIIAYQSQLYPYLDASLVFAISLISLVWYVYLEFGLRERWHSVGTMVASVTMAVSFGEIVNAPVWGYALMAVILAYFFLSISHFYESETEDPLQLAAGYGNAGAILGLGGLIFFPLDFINSHHYGTWANVDSILMYAVVAAILFAVAIGYSREWQKNRKPLNLTLRQVSEVSAGIALTVPAILVCLGTGQAADILVSLVVGVLTIILASYVKLSLYRYLGLATTVLGLLRLLFVAVTQIGLAWPILLLVIGFLLIGVAFLSQKKDYQGWVRRFFAPEQTDHSWFGLGVNPEPIKEGSATFSSRRAPMASGTLALWVILGFITFLVISSIIQSMSSPY